MITIKDALHSALHRFSFLSETEIKIIISALNHIPFNRLTLHYEDGMKSVDDFFTLCERVNDGYPLQYALQQTEFYGLNLYVDERVLIPRGETEELVHQMKDLILNEGLKDPIIADICTGSGAIALAIKNEIKDAKVFASDISKEALSVAKINQEQLGIDIALLEGESLKPLIENNIKIDYLLANPPYINRQDDVQDKVKKYEPHLALYSDDKKVYLDIFKNIDQVMRRDEIVMMLEINELEGLLMLSLARSILGNEVDAKIIKDMHQRDRFILIRYKHGN